MKTWVKVIIGVGCATGIASLIVYLKKKDKDEETVEINVKDGKNVKTKVDIVKPDLSQMAYDAIIDFNRYSMPKNDEKPEKDKPKEGSPHICSEKDYVETYIDYDHHTCTWYPSEKRLVDLDSGFDILIPIHHYVGDMAEQALMSGTGTPGACIFAVNHELRTTYEIIVAEEDQTYSEDLELYSVESGGA